MGSIRTLLALSVVFAHTYGFVFVGGQLAVQLFYVISGFLISYILVEVRTYRSITSFYLNRFLRLFPLYWFIAILTLLAITISTFIFNKEHQLIPTYAALDLDARLSLTISNLILFGQDWLNFTGVKGGEFQFLTNFRESDVPIWNGLLLPQAWTLGLELCFYLIAPFVLIRRNLMITLLLCSLALRAYLIYIGLGTQHPWTYRFFPTELALFLLGACSHQFLKPIYEKKDLLTENISKLITVAIFFCCSVFFLLPYRLISGLLLFSVFILSLPFLFNFQSKKRWDRKIGDLSYPIYISHMLVIWIVGFILKAVNIETKPIIWALIIVLVTIIFSQLINLSIGKFVEKYRNKVKDQTNHSKPC